MLESGTGPLGEQAMALWAEGIVRQALDDGVQDLEALVRALDIPEITAAFGELKTKADEARALEGSRRVDVLVEGVKGFVAASRKAAPEGSQSLLQALIDKKKKDMGED